MGESVKQAEGVKARQELASQAFAILFELEPLAKDDMEMKARLKAVVTRGIAVFSSYKLWNLTTTWGELGLGLYVDDTERVGKEYAGNLSSLGHSISMGAEGDEKKVRVGVVRGVKRGVKRGARNDRGVSGASSSLTPAQLLEGVEKCSEAVKVWGKNARFLATWLECALRAEFGGLTDLDTIVSEMDAKAKACIESGMRSKELLAAFSMMSYVCADMNDSEKNPKGDSDAFILLNVLSRWISALGTAASHFKDCLGRRGGESGSMGGVGGVRKLRHCF